jgi:hypothetical protein
MSVKCINNQHLYFLCSRSRNSKAKRKRSVQAEQTTYTVCTVCYEELNGDLKTLSCEHKFHVGCIGRWLREKVNIMSFNLEHSNNKRFI